MDVGSISAAYNALKAGKELLSGLLEAKAEFASREKLSETLSQLGHAQDTLFELREELFKLQSGNEELRKRIAAFEHWDAQLARYSLIRTAGGAVVYSYNSEPQHFACPSCIAQRQLQILQDNRTASGKYRCPGCKNEYPIRPRGEVARRT